MTATAPTTREQLSDLVTQRLDARDLGGALSACQRLNSAFPDYAYGWYQASFLMKKARNYRDALRAVDRALELAYADSYQLHKAKCHFESGDPTTAQAAAAVLEDRDIADPVLHGELGSLLHLLGDHAAALRHFSRAIELDPRSPTFHFNKAAVQRYLGDAAGAEASFDAAIALDPAEYEAYNGRAQLRAQTPERNHVAQLRALIARTAAPAGLVELHYALAKELEDLGEFEQAFASLEQGAGIKRRHMQYTPEADLQVVASIREVYGPQLFDGRIRGCAGAGAIFIVGMPRTGTTLVERILGSHPQVCALGELNDFALQLTALVMAAAGGKPLARPGFVAASATIDFRALGEAYLRALAPRRDARAWFIDKLPFNFLYAGLIHLALPEAKIISVRRHPMDTCFAVYKQLFRDAYPYSYDLGELGRYFVAYDGLMRHWHEVMPGVIHTVRYEELVADLEGGARRLLEYCGLDWDEQCLRFHENPQASTTASAMQVRQPIYDTSVGKWRKFARQLEPLRAYLDRAGIELA